MPPTQCGANRVFLPALTRCSASFLFKYIYKQEDSTTITNIPMDHQSSKDGPTQSFRHPQRKRIRHPLFLIFSGITVIILVAIIHFRYFYAPTLVPTDPNHRHYSDHEVKACTERNDCPTLDAWLYNEAEVGHDKAVKALLKAGANKNARVRDT